MMSKMCCTNYSQILISPKEWCFIIEFSFRDAYWNRNQINIIKMWNWKCSNKNGRNFFWILFDRLKKKISGCTFLWYFFYVKIFEILTIKWGMFSPILRTCKDPNTTARFHEYIASTSQDVTKEYAVQLILI